MQNQALALVKYMHTATFLIANWSGIQLLTEP